MSNFKFTKPYYNVAKAANEVMLEEAWNVYFEEIPGGGFAIRRRPAMASVAPASVAQEGRGMIWSDRNQKVYMVTSTGVYMKPGKISGVVKLGDLTDFGLPAVFSEGQKIDPAYPIIYIANGGPLHWVDVKPTNTINTALDALGIALPIRPTFISCMNNMFWANDNRFDHNQDFWITDVNPASGQMDPLYWDSPTNPWRATQKPDLITAVTSGWNESYIWGSIACEPWQEDGTNPISPLIGSLMEIGVDSPYSIQMADNTWFLLANVSGKRCVVRIAGRGPKVISEPIARILQSYTTVNDAIGSICYAGGLNVYLLSFPTEGVTWAYDFKSDVWSQWSTWDRGAAQHKLFKGLFHTYASEWNQHLVLDSAGSLYEMSRDIQTDYPGELLHSSVRTGWIDNGTWDRKRCDQLIIKLQGYLPPLVDPFNDTQSPVKVTLRTRDDGRPEWSNPIEMEIQAGVTGQNDHFCKLNRMGIYRSRQYEFIMTDARDLALVGMEIDVTRMRN